MDDEDEVHVITDRRCGKVAFYYYGKIDKRLKFDPALAMFPDGSAIDPNETPKCGSCGGLLHFEDMILDGTEALVCRSIDFPYTYLNDFDMSIIRPKTITPKTANRIKYGGLIPDFVYIDELNEIDKAMAKKILMDMIETRLYNVMGLPPPKKLK